mgnify:CR=1 FL=1
MGSNPESTILTESSGTVSWGTGAPTGAVLNVQQVVKRGTQVISSQTYVLVSGLTITTATPKSSSSKFLIEYTIAGSIYNDTNHGYLQIYKNGSALTDAQADSSGDNTLGSRTAATTVLNQSGAADGSAFSYAMKFLDSPSSSTAVTYAIYGKTSNSNGNLYINRSGRDNDAATHDGRSISTLTIMEIAG